MNDLDEIKIGDCLAIVSTMRGSARPVLQQVISVTDGLVKTRNYTFRKDGRSFSNHQKSLTARPASSSEVEEWEARQKGSEAKTQQREEVDDGVALARYLASVDADRWATLGVGPMKKIRAALERPQKG